MATNSNAVSDNSETDFTFKKQDKKTSNEDMPPIPSLPVVEPLFYDMTGCKYLYIFNHFRYHTRDKKSKTPSERQGTGADVKRLRATFESLGFRVEDFHDLTYKKIMDVVQYVISADHRETSCVAIVIMTHGLDGGVLEAADKAYGLAEIHNKFVNSNNDHLLNKPKLFFIQACRGDELDSGKITTDGAGSDNAIILPTHVDFLTMYSTVPGYVSWRDSQGSWLIQALCDNLEKYSDQCDLLHIITLTNQKVAYTRASFSPNEKHHGKKQMPETQFTLTKFLKFKRGQ